MHKPKITPGAGNVLVEDLETEDEKKLISGSGSIEISGGNSHDQLKYGIILDVGDHTLGAKRAAAEIHKVIDATNVLGLYPGVKVGDIIAYQSLSSHNMRLSGKQYRIVEFEHIKAVIRESK